MTNVAGKDPGNPRRRWAVCGLALAGVVGLCTVLFACTPTVQVATPDKPITINLNIKLDAEVKLRVERKAKEDVQTKSIF